MLARHCPKAMRTNFSPVTGFDIDNRLLIPMAILDYQYDSTVLMCSVCDNNQHVWDEDF
jgi:hypothetical protein